MMMFMMIDAAVAASSIASDLVALIKVHFLQDKLNTRTGVYEPSSIREYPVKAYEDDRHHGHDKPISFTPLTPPAAAVTKNHPFDSISFSACRAA